MSEDIFIERGITPPWKLGGHAAKAQGFARYEGNDWRARREALAALPGGLTFDPDFHFNPDPRKSGRAWTSWLVSALAVDGWAMPRHAVMPDHEDSDFAGRPDTQIRPDVPVQGRLLPAHTHRRLRAERRGREQASPRTRHAASVCDLAPPGHPEAIRHPRGAFLPTGHLHPATGKIVVPLEGWHRHWTHAKYLYTPGNSARRLGTNPLSLEDGYGGDDLFVVVLEGTLKMVAVTEAGYPAIDAGSVTLWRSESPQAAWEDGELVGGMVLELADFAERHLQDRRVAVVCDSDWYSNRLVLDQTRKVTEILRMHGAQAVSCAPPEGRSLRWRHPYTGVEMRAKRGVDDWLGEHDRRDRHDAMLDLVVREPAEDDAPGLEDAVARATRRRDQAETCRRLLRELGRDATDHGIAPYRRDDLAQRTERAPRTLDKARNAIVQAGLLSQLTEAEHRRGEQGWTTEAPLYLMPPELRPPRRSTTLRAWLQNDPY